LAETVNGASRSYNWTYDSLYRLTGETIANAGTVNYAYDAVGNRTNRASTIAQLPANSPAYTANDWLASDTYDPNGNTTASGTASYQYDALNHLTNANNGAILITYDADGNRAKKTVGSTTTYYLLDDRNPSGYVQVLEEWTVVGTATNLSKAYNYGLDLISQRVPSTSTNYFIYDGHGSTRVLTDNAGNVANTFTYDAYGTLIASNTTAQTAYLYSGQQFDADLGFYDNRARYLNVGTGRFWTMDTDEGDQEDPLSLHKYLYCQEDPVDGYDPSGLYTQKFGYAVEKLIRAKYALEHSGQDVNRTGGPIGAGNNPALRPDIWNKSSNPKTYAEIKPLSISGIAHGIGQLNTYERSLKDFGYVRDKWPSGIRTDYYNCQPFFYFNINGLILYTTIEPLVVPALFPAAKALAESQAAQLAKGVVTTLNDVVGKEAMQAVEASSLEVEDGVATVALTEDL
jgi:RHS repeat-associated protein